MNTAKLLKVFYLSVSFFLVYLDTTTIVDEHIRCHSEEHTHTCFVIGGAFKVARAFVHKAADTAALAGEKGNVVLVGLNIVADAVIVANLNIVFYCLFHGDSAHDACAHGELVYVVVHGGGCVSCEGFGNFRVLFAEIVVYEHELENAGGIDQKHIYIHAVFLNICYYADIGKLFKKLKGLFVGEACVCGDAFGKSGLKKIHCHKDFDLVVGHPLFKCFVLSAVFVNFIMTVADFFAKLYKVFSYCHVFSS